MKKWLRRIRGALGMGLIWGAGWGILVGGFMEAFVDPTGQLVDSWPTALAIPGFLSGVVFSTVLGIAEGRRRFDELSLPRFGALGAMVGLLLGRLAVAAGVASALFSGVWLGAAVIIGLRLCWVRARPPVRWPWPGWGRSRNGSMPVWMRRAGLAKVSRPLVHHLSDGRLQLVTSRSC